MGYTALDRMRAHNLKKYQLDSPAVPALEAGDENSLAWCALTFLRENCEELRFDPTAGGKYKKRSGDGGVHKVNAVEDYYGKSFSGKQIPYNMQMDIDRLCLERTLRDFLAEGTARQAYLVYFCYLEMFWTDGEGRDRPRRMIELLSAFEQNVSPLLRRHRDHFVHSVNVFAIGLAIYQQSERFRADYGACYHFRPEQAREAAYHFLKYWGTAALFHDLGYPFELTYQQIGDYFQDSAGQAGQTMPPFVVGYRQKTTDGSAAYEPLYRALFPAGIDPEKTDPPTANDVFAAALTRRLYGTFRECPNYQERRAGEDTETAYFRYLRACLDGRPTDPKYMDHAYFSAYALLHQLWEPGQSAFPTDYLDVLSAILLHNSLFRYTVIADAEELGDYPKMSAAVHPLAFLLMLSDELQCWNRFGYGKKTKRENHPISCDLTFRGEEIHAFYHFDRERDRERNGTYRKFCGPGRTPAFVLELEGFLQIDGKDDLRLEARYDSVERPALRKGTLSHSSFFDLYEVATILNAEHRTRDGYNEDQKRILRKDDTYSEKNRREAFDRLSLEYQLSNLYQVQCYAEHLEQLHMFFTDRQVAYPECTGFSEAELETIGRLKHDAWAKQKRSMGWVVGEHYRTLGAKPDERYKLRERLREHQFLETSFDELGDKKHKDVEPIEQQRLLMLQKYNIRVYRL